MESRCSLSPAKALFHVICAYGFIVSLLWSTFTPQLATATEGCQCANNWNSYWDYVSCKGRSHKQSIILNRAILNQCLRKDSKSVIAELDEAGGKMVLPEYATITFPSGAFTENVTVILEVTADLSMNEAFDFSTAIFKNINRLPYEIRVISSSLPAGTIHISLKLPPEILRNENQKEVNLLAQIREENVMEVLDIFDFITSSFDKSSGTVSASFPDVVFTDKRHPGIAEAVFVLALIDKTAHIPIK